MGGWEGVVDGCDFQVVVVVYGELVVQGDVLDDAGFVAGEVFVDSGVGAVVVGGAVADADQKAGIVFIAEGLVGLEEGVYFVLELHGSVVGVLDAVWGAVILFVVEDFLGGGAYWGSGGGGEVVDVHFVPLEIIDPVGGEAPLVGEALGPEVGGLIAFFDEGFPVGCDTVAVGVVVVGGLEVEQSVAGVILKGGDAFGGCLFGEAAI